LLRPRDALRRVLAFAFIFSPAAAPQPNTDSTFYPRSATRAVSAFDFAFRSAHLTAP